MFIVKKSLQLKTKIKLVPALVQNKFLYKNSFEFNLILIYVHLNDAKIKVYKKLFW